MVIVLVLGGAKVLVRKWLEIVCYLFSFRLLLRWTQRKHKMPYLKNFRMNLVNYLEGKEAVCDQTERFSTMCGFWEYDFPCWHFPAGGRRFIYENVE